MQQATMQAWCLSNYGVKASCGVKASFATCRWLLNFKQEGSQAFSLNNANETALGP